MSKSYQIEKNRYMLPPDVTRDAQFVSFTQDDMLEKWAIAEEN